MISFELSIASCKFAPHGERNGAQNAIYARQVFNDKLLPQGLLFHCECHRLPIIYPLSTSSLHTPSISRQDYSPLQLALSLITIQSTIDNRRLNLNRAQKLEIWGSIYTEITESWNVSEIPDPRSQKIVPTERSNRESTHYPEIPQLSGIHI